MARGEQSISDEPCPVCSKADIDSAIDYGCIQCDGCDLWYHAYCGGLSSIAEYKLAESKKYWFCPECIKCSNFEDIVVKATQNVLADIQVSTNQVPVSPNSVQNIQQVSELQIRNLVKKEIDQMWPHVLRQVKDEIKNDIIPEINIVKEKACNLELRLQDCEKRLRSYDEAKRRKTILIQGIPDSFDVTNPEFIVDIANVLELKLSVFDVNSVMRFKKTNKINSKTPALVQISFGSYLVKQEFMNRYFRYIKTNSLPAYCLDSRFKSEILYINHKLDKSMHEMLSLARHLKQKGNIFKVYIKNNQLMLQKSEKMSPKVIQNINELKMYENTLSCNNVNNPPQMQISSTPSRSLPINLINGAAKQVSSDIGSSPIDGPSPIATH